MSRSAGRKNGVPRVPVLPDPPAEDAKGRDIGESARQDPAGSPIPGLTGNILNYPTVRQHVAVPDGFDEYRGVMAHGVPNDSYTTTERGDAERTGVPSPRPPDRTSPEFHKPYRTPLPIPVYLTTAGAGGRALGSLSARNITVPGWGTGSDPVRIAARDANRTSLYVMVETAAGTSGAAPTGIRISREIAPLANAENQGALLRAGMATYQKLDNMQDELFAISNDGSACTISVMAIYDELAVD